MGAAGTAAGSDDPSPLPLAVSVCLCPSRLGAHAVASGLGHLGSGIWIGLGHLGSGITVELFSRSLAAFAQQAGAGPSKEIVLVLDQAGWHRSQRVVIPSHVHLVPLPPYTPELQPAERLWIYSNTPLINRRPADLEELDTLQLDRCAALQTDPALRATTQSATHYHWWPADYSPTT